MPKYLHFSGSPRSPSLRANSNPGDKILPRTQDSSCFSCGGGGGDLHELRKVARLDLRDSPLPGRGAVKRPLALAQREAWWPQVRVWRSLGSDLPRCGVRTGLPKPQPQGEGCHPSERRAPAPLPNLASELAHLWPILLATSRGNPHRPTVLPSLLASRLLSSSARLRNRSQRKQSEP